MSDKVDSITPPPAGASPIAPGTLDRHGTPFDGKKHLPKKHPTGGNWLPKGGYTKEARAANAAKKAQAPAAAAPVAPAPVIPAAAPLPSVPIQTVSADPTASLVEHMAMNMPAVSSESGKPAGDGPEASYIAPDESLPPMPEREPDAPAATGVRPTAPAAPDPADQGDPDADAEIALEMLFDLVGFGTGHADEARPVSARVVSMRRVLSAWLKKKGWVSVGGWAVTISFLAYLTDLMRKPKTAATVKGWFGIGKKTEDERAAAARNVTGTGEQIAPAPVAPVVPATPPRPSDVGGKESVKPFAGIHTE